MPLSAQARRILLIEDEPDTLELVASVLRGSGFEVQEAANLKPALEHLDVSHFGLVLTDLFGSSLDEAADPIRPLRQAPRPRPVGVITAWSLKEIELRLPDVRFVLAKPFD